MLKPDFLKVKKWVYQTRWTESWKKLFSFDLLELHCNLPLKKMASLASLSRKSLSLVFIKRHFSKSLWHKYGNLVAQAYKWKHAYIMRGIAWQGQQKQIIGFRFPDRP